jgi:hypothetical protein
MKDAFLVEFKALLEKYNVDIYFSVSPCSDTYGLSEEKIVVSQKDKVWLEVDGWGIESCDIKTESEAQRHE